MTVRISPQPISGAVYMDPISRFWKSLIDAKEVHRQLDWQEGGITGTFLHLPDGVELLGQNGLGSILYVRECYRALYTMITQQTMQLPGAMEAPRWILTGNPGIGKSLFLAYLLWRARCEGATVVYEPSTVYGYMSAYMEKRYLMRPDGTCLSGQAGLCLYEDELDQPSTWYIADAHAPTRQSARTLFVSAPLRSSYGGFEKLPGTFKCFMPVWTWEEVEICWRFVFRNDERVPQSRVRELFSYWGGIPRMVLEKPLQWSDDVIMQMLESSSRTCTLAMCERSIGEIGGQDELPYNILHIIVGEDYRHSHMAFASARVVEMMLNRFLIFDRTETFEFINEGCTICPQSTLRFELLQQLAQDQIHKEVSIIARDLKTGRDFEVKDIGIDSSHAKKTTFTYDQNNLSQRSYLSLAAIAQPGESSIISDVHDYVAILVIDRKASQM